jgi:hypothetical protein
MKLVGMNVVPARHFDDRLGSKALAALAVSGVGFAVVNRLTSPTLMLPVSIRLACRVSSFSPRNRKFLKPKNMTMRYTADDIPELRAEIKRDTARNVFTIQPVGSASLHGVCVVTIA